MNEALLVLAGTAMGLFGTLMTDTIRSRRQADSLRLEEVRRACTDLISSLNQMRQIYFDEQHGTGTPEWHEQMRQTHLNARLHYERLQLTTTSIEVQINARFAIRYAVGLWRELRGRPLRPDEVEVHPLRQLDDRLVSLRTAMRRELSVPNPDRVLSEQDFFALLPARESPFNMEKSADDATDDNHED
jgi:hypothetical protein